METILKEETFDVCGTTKLTVGDPMYLEAIADGTDKGCEKKLVFDGSISGAPLGKLRIREIHCIENGLEWDVVDTTISKRGRSKLRAVLFNAAIPLIAKNPEFKSLHEYYTTRANNPLKKKQSVIAISCKLIRVFYAILANGVTYDAQKMLSDIHRQPQAA